MRWDTDRGEFYFNSTNDMGIKIAIHKYADPESVIKECEDSLTRLNTDYIDLYQIHWPDPTTPIESTMEAVLRLKEQGKIRAAGVSNYSAEQMKIAEKVIEIETNQMPYSMVLRDIEEDIVPYCLKTGKGILAYSPLQRGLLTGKITSDYHFNEGDHRPSTPFFKEPNLTRINQFLNTIKPLADDHHLSLAQLVLCWTLEQPAINTVLVGARNPKQVKENAISGDVRLEKSVIEEINSKLGDLHLNLSV
jgi:aryl-alcohol dehydrogenase-like predicted oxidoreductase